MEDGDQHLKALRAPRVRRHDRGRVPDALALGSFAVAHTRLANGDWPDAGHDLALRKMAMAHHALLARLGLEISMLCEKLSNLRLDRLGQQRTRAAAQDLGQGIGEGPCWASLITLLSDTAYHSFIREVEALNTTTIRRLTPSCRHQFLAITPG